MHNNWSNQIKSIAHCIDYRTIAGVYNVEASFLHCLALDTIKLIVQPGTFSYTGSNESICQFETFNLLNCNILPNAINIDSLLWFGGLGTLTTLKYFSLSICLQIVNLEGLDVSLR